MKRSRQVFNHLASLKTESRNPRTTKIDISKTEDILLAINREDESVAGAVKKEISNIRKAVEIVVAALSHSGRLIFVGAGTSGRLGVIDAAECPPTFGSSPKKILGIMAGGKKAVFRSQEGAEDDVHQAIEDLRALNITRKDVVCGIAASSRTPYVVKSILEAKKRGAKTIFVTTNPRSSLNVRSMRTFIDAIDVAICPVVGPEAIMGSTRMKSGTAQKMVLNMITTTAMIRLGKVFENMMVDLKMNSRKLEERAKRVLMISTGSDYTTATNILKKANGHVKTAIVMIKSNVTAAEARRRLKRANGFVRYAIER
jgi:N-acetylmuramic acid 6-phosphate etherase